MQEIPIRSFSAPVTVSASSSTWTNTTATPTAGRGGIFISNPGSSSDKVAGIFSACDGSALPATKIRPLEIGKGEDKYFPITDKVCLYVLSLNTSAAINIHLQEVSQLYDSTLP